VELIPTPAEFCTSTSPPPLFVTVNPLGSKDKELTASIGVCPFSFTERPGGALILATPFATESTEILFPKLIDDALPDGTPLFKIAVSAETPVSSDPSPLKAVAVTTPVTDAP